MVNVGDIMSSGPGSDAANSSRPSSPVLSGVTRHNTVTDFIINLGFNGTSLQSINGQHGTLPPGRCIAWAADMIRVSGDISVTAEGCRE